MTSPSAPQGNEPPAGGGSYPLSSFGYTPTYPTSSYPAGSGSGAGIPAAGSQGPAGSDEVSSWPWSARKWAGVIAVALLCGVVAGLAWVGWTSRTVADVAVGPSTPAAAGPSVASGPPVNQAAAAAAVEAWLHGGGQLVIDNLAADYHRVAAAMTANDMTELTAGCTALRSSAETAQAYPPIPDSEAQVHWSASLAQSARSGTDCLAGLSSNSGVLITQGGHEAGASSRESALMNARLGTLRGN